MCAHSITVMGRGDYEVLITPHECFMTQSLQVMCKKYALIMFQFMYQICWLTECKIFSESTGSHRGAHFINVKQTLLIKWNCL